MTYQQPYPSAQPALSSEPPLWAPYYGAPIGAAARRFFKKSTFSGRASRSEYWWWTLIAVVVSIVLNIIIGAGTTTNADGTTDAGPGAFIGTGIGVVWAMVTFIPGLALAVRRLHDVNMSGWLLLLLLVPFLGALAVLVFMVLPSNPAGQRYDRPEGVAPYQGY